MRWKCTNCRQAAERKYYIEYPDRAISTKDRADDWWRRNPELRKEVKQVWRANSRAQALGLAASLTLEEWQDIKVRHDNHCAWPGCESTDIQLDHIIPLCNGGATVAENIQPLCEPHNQQKGAA
jgi:5-methylcytosine-specific restriction endonuclease McrA